MPHWVLYDSMPIADMGKFQELLQRRAAQGASPLRDPLLDHDEMLRSDPLPLYPCLPKYSSLGVERHIGGRRYMLDGTC